MDNACYITNPLEDLKALALIYVQSHDLSSMTPEAVLNLYNETLTRMWTHYENNLG